MSSEAPATGGTDVGDAGAVSDGATATAGRRAARTVRRVSGWYAVLVLTAGTCVTLSASALHDPDVYWHRVLGQRWLSGQWSLRPDPVSYSPGRHWFSSSWLTEATYAGLVGQFGYDGVVWLRFVLAAAFFAGLAVLLLRSGVRTPTAAVTHALVALPAFAVVQDRPQTVSLLFLLVLSWQLDVAVRSRRLPHPVPVGLFTWLWANLHGLWVLVPLIVVVLTVSLLVEGRIARRRLVTASSWCLGAALLAAAVTPVGPRLLLAPILVRSAAGSQIGEWQATQLWSPLAWGLAATLVIVVVGWARQAGATPRSEVLIVLAVSVLGLSAFRFAVPASVLLAPLAARRLEGCVPALRRSAVTVPRAVPIALALVIGMVAAGKYAEQRPVSADFPQRIAAYLQRLDRPVRVMPAYNVSGFVREFGGDDVRVAIDGRTDRYGDDVIRRYNSAMRGERSWRRVVASYDPDYLVVDRAAPLASLLPAAGWQQVGRDHGYVLYAAPGPAPGR